MLAWEDVFIYAATPIEGIKLIKANQLQSLAILERTSNGGTRDRGATRGGYSTTGFYRSEPIIELAMAEIQVLNSQKPFHEDGIFGGSILFVAELTDLNELNFK